MGAFGSERYGLGALPPAPGQTIPPRIVEIRAGLPGAVGRTWTNPLAIDPEITLTSGRKPNAAKIVIHNLGLDSVAFLSRAGVTVEVLAGERVPGLIFRGEITGAGDVRTEDKPGGRTTEIEPKDGRRQWLSSTISRSWPPNTTRDRILRDLILAAGWGVGFISPQLPPRTYASGYVYRGRPRDGIDDVLAADGARWSHDTGSVSVLMPGDTTPGNSPVIAPDSGLIGSPKRKGKTVSFETKFDARIRPNGGVEIQSRYVKGIYRVTKVKHRPHNRGIIWRSQAEVVEP